MFDPLKTWVKSTAWKYPSVIFRPNFADKTVTQENTIIIIMEYRL